ncbi:TRAP transporter small permease [Xanthobacteraceae bacterium Astr-EGSB]|uniref:TRAP transporter small permease n=1 Tax=Astrobacterium formosum TaxID=3069710 RepID=UPI0027B18D5F|nr:TRAP transporter small permease [Xanthobacteraceae bacterium Astr-EGSB]
MVSQALAGLRTIERVLAASFLAIIVVLVSMSSTARYFGYPVIWALEAVQALFVWLCVFAADLTLQRWGHFSVDMLASLLPPRARRALDMFNLLLILALIAVLTWFGARLAIVTSGRPLPIIGISQAAATAALPIGFCLMGITILEKIAALVRGGEVARSSDTSREVM